MSGTSATTLIPVALFLIVVVLLFWSTIIRPQVRAQKAHENLVQELKIGDKVITAGGMHGRIAALDDKTFTLEVSKDVRGVFDRRAARRRQD